MINKAGQIGRVLARIIISMRRGRVSNFQTSAAQFEFSGATLDVVRELPMLQRTQITIKTSYHTHNRAINAIVKAAGILPGGLKGPPEFFRLFFWGEKTNSGWSFRFPEDLPAKLTSGGSLRELQCWWRCQ